MCLWKKNINPNNTFYIYSNVNPIKIQLGESCIEKIGIAQKNIIKKLKSDKKKMLTHRKCTNVNCLQEFKYPSGLKRHYELSALCKKKPDEIKVCFSGLKERQPQKYKCDICNTLYTKKCSLTRHLLNSKCNIS